jgi:hypothetical protein
MSFFVIPQPHLNADDARQGAVVLIGYPGEAFATRAEAAAFRQTLCRPGLERDDAPADHDTATWVIVEADTEEAAVARVLRAAFAAAGLPPQPPLAHGSRELQIDMPAAVDHPE